MEQDVRRVIAELAMAVLTANGRVSAAERGALAELDGLGFGPISILCNPELLRDGYQPRDWRQLCGELASLDARHRAAIVRALAEIAASDDHVCGNEIETVKEVAALLGLSRSHAVSLLNRSITRRAAERAGRTG